METIKKAYEITAGSAIVFVNSMYFAGLVTALIVDLIYQIICWAAWILSI
ncbi:MAG: hypothetical protein IJV46_06935 [Acidaminococcaceae bacterium]|nr:hypothetical protein [Acidaminococcaceae bacterium]